MAKPCKDCPFRVDKTPFLHPERAYDLAVAAQNPYSSFPCHKTTEHDEDSDDGERMWVNTTKDCAGFLTLQAQYENRTPEGFEPAFEECYEDADHMYEAYEEEWEK